MENRDKHGNVYEKCDADGDQCADLASGDFSWALLRLKQGFRLHRSGWNGKGMWLGMQDPKRDLYMTLPYIYMHTAQGQRVPWLASQTDLLAEDWYQI